MKSLLKFHSELLWQALQFYRFPNPEALSHSRYQLPVHLLNQRVHLLTKQLIHFPQPAQRIERRILEIIAFEAEGGRDVVADEF